MKNSKSKTQGRSNVTTALKNKAGANDQDQSSEGMESSQLMKLFENGLKDIYWAEKALMKALPKMIKNATSEELVEALESHLEVTEEQVTRCEAVFESIGKKATAKKCAAMEGLIKEGEEIMSECEEGAMLDAGIIAAGQKVEHYEIASYGTLRQWAETLGLEEAVSLLEQTLEEERAADEKLTEVAVSAVNVQASEEEEEDSEEEDESEEEEEEVPVKKSTRK